MNPIDQMLVEATTRVQRQNQIRLTRWISLLDLQPPLNPDGLRRAVDDELVDQKARARAALEPLRAEHGEDPAFARAQELFSEDGATFDRPALAALLDAAPAPLAAVLATVAARHDAFVARLGWLLRPSTFAEIQKLDPKRDCNQIYHFISYEFRVEQKLFAVLFETRPVLIPYSALMFHSTGEFTLRAFKRISDTAMFFSNMLEWGLDSRRGRAAVARVNGIHGRYSIASDAFKFILLGIMFVPSIWNEKLGWRKLTDVERLGWFHAFVEMGRAMNIQGLTDDYDEMHAWWRAESERAGESSPVGAKTFVEIALQVLQTYPEELRRPILGAILAGMDDTFREMLDVPPPPAAAVGEIREALSVIGKASSSMPRVPWIRSLQTYPLYYDLDDIGVSQRSSFLPASGAHGALPVAAADPIPTATLPVFSREEVAKHSTSHDAWVLIDGLIYDVSRFLYEHPGGERVLLTWAGRDASLAFAKVGHSHSAQVMMANFVIGRVAEHAAHAPVPVHPSLPDKVHRGRRAGRDKSYAEGSWEATLDLYLGLIDQYDRVVRKGGKPDAKFAVPLPMDPRVVAGVEPTGRVPAEGTS